MISSVSGQGELNPVLWLANQTGGKIAPFCQLGITYCFPQDNSYFSYIINPLLAKLVWLRWLNIGRILFFCVIMELS